MDKFTFLGDHGFETLECHAPPDFNLWVLRMALDSIDRGEHSPLVEEAISVADRIRLPTLEEPFPPEELMNPKIEITPAHVGSVLLQARDRSPQSPVEASRWAGMARVAAASLHSVSKLRHELVGFSLVVDANGLVIGGQIQEAELLLARAQQLALSGFGSLDLASYLVGVIGALLKERGDAPSDLGSYAIASRYYFRAMEYALGASYACAAADSLRNSGAASEGLQLIDSITCFVPKLSQDHAILPIRRGWCLSNLRRHDEALFELSRFDPSHVRRPRWVPRLEWAAGLIERQSGKLERARARLNAALRGLHEERSLWDVVWVVHDLAILEGKADNLAKQLEHLNFLTSMIRRTDVPRRVEESLYLIR